jgi:ABC-2 type transport system permease protein
MVIKLTLLYYRNLIKAGDSKKLILYVIIGLLMVGSFGTQCFALAAGGAGISVPVLMYVYNCFFCLLAGVPSAKAVLFGFKDYDTQMSWPVSESAVVASRISIFLIAEELYAFLLLIPAFSAYAYFERPGLQILPIAIILIVTAPVIPSVVGSILGGFVAWLGGKFKGGKAFQYIGLLVVLIASMSFGMLSSRFSQPGTGGTMAESLKSLAARLGPGILFANAAAGSWLDTFLFALLSVAVCVIFMLIFGRSFRRMNSVVTAVATRGKFKQKKDAWKSSGVFGAMFKKELGMLFGSPVYMLNSTFGALMLIITSAVIAFIPLSKILGVFGAPADALPANEVMTAYMLPYIPLGLGWFAAMNCTTCASISIEGKRLSSLVSLPVKASRILLAKFLVNIFVNGVCVIVCGVLLSVRFKPDALTAIEIFAVPLLFSWFISALGLRINLWLPKLDWTTEQQAIKQSASAFITVFAGMILAMVPILPAFLVGVHTATLWAMPVIALISLLLTILIFPNSERKLLKLI